MEFYDLDHEKCSQPCNECQWTSGGDKGEITPEYEVEWDPGGLGQWYKQAGHHSDYCLHSNTCISSNDKINVDQIITSCCHNVGFDIPRNNFPEQNTDAAGQYSSHRNHCNCGVISYHGNSSGLPIKSKSCHNDLNFSSRSRKQKSDFHRLSSNKHLLQNCDKNLKLVEFSKSKEFLETWDNQFDFCKKTENADSENFDVIQELFDSNWKEDEQYSFHGNSTEEDEEDSIKEKQLENEDNLRNPDNRSKFFSRAQAKKVFSKSKNYIKSKVLLCKQRLSFAPREASYFPGEVTHQQESFNSPCSKSPSLDRRILPNSVSESPKKNCQYRENLLCCRNGVLSAENSCPEGFTSLQCQGHIEPASRSVVGENFARNCAGTESTSIHRKFCDCDVCEGEILASCTPFYLTYENKSLKRECQSFLDCHLSTDSFPLGNDVRHFSRYDRDISAVDEAENQAYDNKNISAIVTSDKPAFENRDISAFIVGKPDILAQTSFRPKNQESFEQQLEQTKYSVQKQTTAGIDPPQVQAYIPQIRSVGHDVFKDVAIVSSSWEVSECKALMKPRGGENMPGLVKSLHDDHHNSQGTQSDIQSTSDSNGTSNLDDLHLAGDVKDIQDETDGQVVLQAVGEKMALRNSGDDNNNHSRGESHNDNTEKQKVENGSGETTVSHPQINVIVAEDEDFPLGSEACTLDTDKQASHPMVIDKRMQWLMGTPNNQSYCSDLSQMTTSSNTSDFSVEMILEERNEDPEEILQNLGFGNTCVQEDPIEKIPERFLSSPMDNDGINFRPVTDDNVEINNLINQCNVVGSADLGQGQAQNPKVMSTPPVIEGNPQFGHAFYNVMSSMRFLSALQSQTPPFPSSVNNSYDSLTHPGDDAMATQSVLHPENREWLARQGFYDLHTGQKKTPEPVPGKCKPTIGKMKKAMSLDAAERRKMFKKSRTNQPKSLCDLMESDESAPQSRDIDSDNTSYTQSFDNGFHGNLTSMEMSTDSFDSSDSGTRGIARNHRSPGNNFAQSHDLIDDIDSTNEIMFFSPAMTPTSKNNTYSKSPHQQNKTNSSENVSLEENIHDASACNDESVRTEIREDQQNNDGNETEISFFSSSSASPKRFLSLKTLRKEQVDKFMSFQDEDGEYNVSPSNSNSNSRQSSLELTLTAKQLKLQQSSTSTLTADTEEDVIVPTNQSEAEAELTNQSSVETELTNQQTDSRTSDKKVSFSSLLRNNGNFHSSSIGREKTLEDEIVETLQIPVSNGGKFDLQKKNKHNLETMGRIESIQSDSSGFADVDSMEKTHSSGIQLCDSNVMVSRKVVPLYRTEKTILIGHGGHVVQREEDRHSPVPRPHEASVQWEMSPRDWDQQSQKHPAADIGDYSTSKHLHDPHMDLSCSSDFDLTMNRSFKGSSHSLPEETLDYVKLVHLVNRPLGAQSGSKGKFIPKYDPKHWASLSRKLQMEEETRLVHHALQKCVEVLDSLEEDFNLNRKMAWTLLSEEERLDVEEMQALYSEVRKEICKTETHLTNRIEGRLKGNDNFTPLLNLEMIQNMIDLLKEQHFQLQMNKEYEAEEVDSASQLTNSTHLSPSHSHYISSPAHRSFDSSYTAPVSTPSHQCWLSSPRPLYGSQSMLSSNHSVDSQLAESLIELKASILQEVKQELRESTQWLCRELELKDRELNKLRVEMMTSSIKYGSTRRVQYYETDI